MAFYSISPAEVASLRKSLMLTQAEFGEAIGITGGAVQRIERVPSPRVRAKTMRRLAELMKVDPATAVTRLAAKTGATNANGVFHQRSESAGTADGQVSDGA